jgi:hypothetical protein
MEELNVLIEPVRAALVQVAGFLPRLVLAAVVVVAGWLAAKLARFAVVRGLRAINFHVVTERAGLDDFVRQGGVRRDTTDILGLLVYWLVVLAALIIAFNGLGLTYITDLLRELVRFVPKVILALVILAFGAYFALFIGNTVLAYCRATAMPDAELLARIARYAVLAFVVLIALDQMDIGGNVVRLSFLIVLAGVVLGLALAFGLGGRDWAARLLERWWPRPGREDPPR